MRVFLAMALMFVAMPAMATLGGMGMVNRKGVQPCDQIINSLTSFRGATYNPDGKKFSFKPLVGFTNGKLTVNRDNPNFKSVETVDGKTIVKFKEPFFVNGACPNCTKQGGIQTSDGVTTLVFEETSKGYAVKYNTDPAAVKAIDEANKDNKYPGMGIGPWGMGMGMPVAQNATVDKVDGNQCEFNQDSFTNRMLGKDAETVIYDQKFCKSIEGTLKEKGFDKISACKNTFEEIGKKYFDRAGEISKEKPGTFFNDYSTSPMTTMTAVAALQSCAPNDWQERWSQEYMKANFPQQTTSTTPTGVPGPGNR